MGNYFHVTVKKSIFMLLKWQSFRCYLAVNNLCYNSLSSTQLAEILYYIYSEPEFELQLF
jgi:hypothetical protein